MRLSLFAPLDRLFAPAPAPGRLSWIAGSTFAHRGLHGAGVLENSPAAFAAAVAKGMGIECDVQHSADDQAVVFHDWELDGLTGDSGAVIGRSAAQLGAIRLNGEADGIPTLRQVLGQIVGKVPLLIEVKSREDTQVAALCQAVRRDLEGYHGPHAVMSFDPRISAWFARHAPATARGLVITEENDKGLFGRMKRHLSLWQARPDFLAYDVRDLPSRFAAAQRARGIPVTSWTVRSPELLARAAVHADAPIAEGGGVI